MAIPADSSQFQNGYRPVPISEAGQGGPLCFCVVVRDVPDPVAGLFVRLRDVVDASVYLGCLVDSGGWVHEWVELWIQNINDLQAAPQASREALTNHALDECWKRRARFLARLDRFNKIEIPAEESHPLPIYFDLAVSAPVHPSQAEAPWELCTDDRLLEQHNLPPYTGSLARYLSVRGAPAPPFLPVTPGAPENESTQDPADVLGPLVPLNPDGGFMMALKHAPLAFETYVDLLGGEPWKGIEEGSKVFQLTGVYRALQTADAREYLLAKGGRGGRFVETFHLKLDLLLQAFRLVRDFIRAEQLPFLNLSADFFRVSLSETSSTLPFLWTAKVSLAGLGSAFALPAGQEEGRYFSASGGASIYRARAVGAPVRAAGAASIDHVIFEEDGAVVLEGTLLTQERINPSDLLWLRFTFSPGRVDFFAFLRADAAAGGYSFRTFPKKLADAMGVALRSAEGMRFPDVPFETLQSQSAWQDVHALGVLGVRALLVNDDMPLAAALDQIRGLAGAVALDSPEGIAPRLRSAVAADSSWVQALGPHRLLKSQSITQEEALACLPPELWWDAVALLIQCLAEKPPADAGSLDSAFDLAISGFQVLSHRSRSLLFSDWKYSAEVNAVLQAALQRHLAESALSES